MLLTPMVRHISGVPPFFRWFIALMSFPISVPFNLLCNLKTGILPKKKTFKVYLISWVWKVANLMTWRLLKKSVIPYLNWMNMESNNKTFQLMKLPMQQHPALTETITCSATLIKTNMKHLEHLKCLEYLQAWNVYNNWIMFFSILQVL